jgi:hypothetical protein
VVETSLVEKAARFSPDQLRRIARRAIEAVEPDQKIVDAHENEHIRAEEQAARAKCSLSLHDNGDGTTTGHFTIPALAAAMLSKVIDAMSAPRRMREGAADRSFDWRHRRGLAFAELLEHLRRSRRRSRGVTNEQEERSGGCSACEASATPPTHLNPHVKPQPCYTDLRKPSSGFETLADARSSTTGEEAWGKDSNTPPAAPPDANAPTPGASSTTDNPGP